MLHRLGQPGIDRLAHIGDDGRLFHCDTDSQRWLPVHEKSISLRFGKGAFHTGDIAEADAFPVQRSDQ